MATNYRKWDKLVDSDDDNDASESRQDYGERVLDLKDDLRQWMRRQIEAAEEDFFKRQHRETSGERAGAAALFSPKPKWRKVTDEELKTLATFLLLVVYRFEAGSANRSMHGQLVELARQHRWLEEDPGTLKLLCKIHMADMKKSGKVFGGDAAEDPTHERFRAILMTGINTIAAAQSSELPGGILETIIAVCTPATDSKQEIKDNWQKNKYAKKALQDCLMDVMLPDYDSDDAYSDGRVEDDWTMYVVLGCVLFGLVMVIAFFIYSPTKRPSDYVEDSDLFKWLFDGLTGNATTSNISSNYSETYYTAYNSQHYNPYYYYYYGYYDDQAEHGPTADPAEL